MKPHLAQPRSNQRKETDLSGMEKGKKRIGREEKRMKGRESPVTS